MRVTVLMAVYNGEKYLREAIDSILCQTFGDFEFLIIDDGSTDKSVEIVKSYNDQRINLALNEQNLGLAASLNKGIKLARGEYIARMDHDDISMPERLEKQVGFLDLNHDIGACGSWIETFGDGKPQVCKYSTEPDVIKAKLFFFNTIAHPTVMIRKDLLLENKLYFIPEYKRAQDFDFWQRCSFCFNIANIAKVLVKYRINPKERNSHAGNIAEALVKIDQYNLKHLGIEASEEELMLHQAICPMRQPPIPYSIDFAVKSEIWLKKLLEANHSSKCYPERIFAELLGERWFAVCNKNAEKYGFWIWRIFWKSPLSKLAKLSLKARLKLLLKCLNPKISL